MLGFSLQSLVRGLLCLVFGSIGVTSLILLLLKRLLLSLFHCTQLVCKHQVFDHARALVARQFRVPLDDASQRLGGVTVFLVMIRL